MGYFLILFMLVSSLRAMQEGKATYGSSMGDADLLVQIKAAKVEGVRECLFRGVHPDSIMVNGELDFGYYVNEFVTEAMQLKDTEKRYEILRLLLDHGVHPDHSVRCGDKVPQKMPMLSYVIEKFGVGGSLPQEVLLLLAHKANVEQEDFLQNPPLFHALQVRNAEILKALRLSGAKSINLPEDESTADSMPADIHMLLTDLEQYQKAYPYECAIIQSKIEELRRERQ